MKAALFAALFAVAAPSFAQDAPPLDKRVGRLEGEMRAVQRKVFPGGDPKFFEPEIAAAPPVVVAPVGTPASAPLTDLTERVGELERQLRTLTGQVEANQFEVRQLKDAQAKLRGDLEFRLTALEGGAKPVVDAGPAAALPPGGKLVKGADTAKPAKADPAKAPPAKPVTETSAWKAAYAGVTAKDWDSVAPAMTDFLATYPKSPRASQAQYWLGKASAAKGDNASAARAYLAVYKDYPKSERTPDSLIGLAGAMTALKKPKDACRVLGELDSVFGETLTAGQKAEAKAAGAKAKCG